MLSDCWPKASSGKIALVLLATLWLFGGHLARAVRATPHQDPWAQALLLRQQLEESPPPLRSPAQYEAVLNAFRRIYHDNPTAAKAPAAVAAVADLLAEKGRLLHDPKSLRAAIGQYEFLLQQYPDSPQVANALLLEAEICRQDLGDGACAADKLHQVIANSPGSSFAEQAALELAELNKVDHPRSSKQSLRSSPTSGAKAAPEQTIEPLPTSPPTPPGRSQPIGSFKLLRLRRPKPPPSPIPSS